MQCKDIPDKTILEFLATHGLRGPGTWCALWQNQFAEGNVDITTAFPPNTPEKLVLAKMRSLIRRGLADGCYCGCRGDFEITAKGRKALGDMISGSVQ